jgi:lactobin A/cerein 7B family class IIb bacteriocin
MIKLSNEELMNVNGGGFNIGLFAAITAGVTFIISIIDGIVRPIKCK